KEGALIRTGEPVFELETDKATQDVPAPADGVLSVTVAEGTKVQIGSVVGHIAAGDGASREPAQPKLASRERERPEAQKPEKVVMPAARQAAADAGIDLEQITGTGRE